MLEYPITSHPENSMNGPPTAAELFDRITYLFDGQSVPENGMFFVAWATPYTVKFLDRLGILYVTLAEDGKNKYLRFN